MRDLAECVRNNDSSKQAAYLEINHLQGIVSTYNNENIREYQRIAFTRLSAACVGAAMKMTEATESNRR